LFSQGKPKSANQVEMSQSSATKVFVFKWEKHTCRKIQRCLLL